MLEPISAPLWNLLREHNLCSPGDLRRCRRIVQRLAADLPAFDSVWLDALSQLGKLTPFQVRILESQNPSEIALGPCLLVDQISTDCDSQTYLARLRGSSRRLALKLLTDSHACSDTVRPAWHRLVERMKRVQSPAVCGPQVCEETPRGLVLVSPYVAGPTLHDLLVRRGRFAPAIVAEIGRQLTAGLAALELAELHHADVRLANVRLHADGQVVLVDTGIRAIIEPEQTIHSGLPPDRFDGVAPELIGTQRSADFPSDLYSLGCLLWQLLAGRPPFPGGDPLLKLAAHQTRSIPDVRQFAPDTPERLADLIFRLTRSKPHERPANVAAVLVEWTTVAAANPKLLHRFRREFDHPKRLADRANGPRTATRVAATAIVVAFLTVGFFWKPEWTEPMRGVLPTGSPVPAISESAGGPEDGDPVVAASHEGPDNNHQDGGSSPSVVPAAAVEAKSIPARRTAKLPNPDGQGVILLEAGEHYRGRAINAVGPLIIRTKGETPAIIHLDAPLELVAETVRLERVTLAVDSLAEGSREDSLAACIDLRAQSISADGVTVWNRAISRSTTAVAASLRWELVDDRDTRPTSAVFTDCVFQGGSATLVVPQPVSVVQFTNCLHQGQECVLELAGSARRTREVVLRLQHVTCREMGGVVRWWGEVGPPTGIRLTLDARDSLLHLRNENSAVCTLLSERYTSAWLKRLKVSGEGSVIPPETVLVTWQSDQSDETQVVDSPELDVEGLLAIPFQFRGPLSEDPRSAEVANVAGPRRSKSPPGYAPKASGER